MNRSAVRAKQVLIALTIIGLLLVNWFEFHDIFEAKTVPEWMTGVLSIPIILLLLQDLFSLDGKAAHPQI